MSENIFKKFDPTILAGIGIAFAALIGYLVLSGDNSDVTEIVSNTDAPANIVPAVATIENDEVVEEVIVVADPNNLPSDEELATDELVEKAQEAAIRNQVNQAMKKSEDTDIVSVE